jgi:hypothetical protein
MFKILFFSFLLVKIVFSFPLIAQVKNMSIKGNVFIISQTKSGNLAARDRFITGFEGNFIGSGLSIEKKMGKNVSGELLGSVIFNRPISTYVSGRIYFYSNKNFEGFFWGGQLGFSPHKIGSYINIGSLMGFKVKINENIIGRGIFEVGLGSGRMGGLYISTGLGVGGLFK